MGKRERRVGRGEWGGGRGKGKGRRRGRERRGKEVNTHE